MVNFDNFQYFYVANEISIIFVEIIYPPMITTTHLVMVSVFLKQELPPLYNDLITIEDEIIVISLPDNFKPFSDNYNEVFNLINEQVQRIRNRECDLSFTVKTASQWRDFKIDKQ